MEVKLVVTLVAWMLFCVSNRGYAFECNMSDLSVTRDSVPGQHPLYLVAVKNRCICTQTNVKLACPGFNSSIPVNPAGIVTPDGDNKLCSLNVPVTGKKAVKFYYASNTKFSFAVTSSDVTCSMA